MEHGGLSLTIAANRQIEIIDDVGCVACVLDGQVRVSTRGIRQDTIARRGENVTLKRSSKSLLRALCDTVVFIQSPRGAMRSGFGLCRATGRSVLTIAMSGRQSVAQLERWLALTQS